MVAAVCLLWTSALLAQDPPKEGGGEKPLKIGFANIKQIIDNYKRTQTIEGEIDRFREQQSDAIEQQVKQAKALADEIKILNPGTRLYVSKRKKLKRMENEIKMLEEELRLDLQLKLLKATKQIYEDISDQIGTFAKEKGYSVIFKVEKGEIESESKAELILKINSRGVLYYDRALEITEEITKIMNERYTGQKPTEKKEPKEGEGKEGEGKEGEGKEGAKEGEGKEGEKEGEGKEGGAEKAGTEGSEEKKPTETESGKSEKPPEKK
jgi:Skp family chaperone for outer membrane proteins